MSATSVNERRDRYYNRLMHNIVGIITPDQLFEYGFTIVILAGLLVGIFRREQ
jgi:hypothetical protein